MSLSLTVGVAVAKIVLRSAGYGDAAGQAGDAAAAAQPLVGHLRRPRGIQTVGIEIAKDLDELLAVEYRDLEPNDREAVVAGVTELLTEHLADPQLLVKAAIDRERLRRFLWDHGGERRAQNLGGDAEGVFGLLLTRCADRIAELAPSSPAFVPAAATALVRGANEAGAAFDELLKRPITGSISAADARGYRAELEALAPPALLGREDELDVLADFARHGRGRWFGYRAPPKSGKTALLATFALHPPPGVEVVPFFIHADQSEARTRGVFLGIVLSRLAELAGRDYVPVPVNPVQERRLLDELLSHAAATCQARSRPAVVLLLVDGLDEDAYYGDPTRQSGSIAALLPPEPPGGVRILLACRPNPPLPDDLRAGAAGARHPLNHEEAWHPLEVSPHAQAAFSDHDVAELMRDPVGEAIGGYLAATGASLTARTLRGLVHLLHPTITLSGVQDRLDRSPGRVLLPVEDGSLPGVPSYRLGHDLISQRVVSLLSAEDLPPPHQDDRAEWDKLSRRVLKPWRARVREWADTFVQEEWPDPTPDYLLDPAFPDLLEIDARDDPAILDALVGVLTDPRRSAAIRRRHGAAASAWRQVHDAADWLVRGPDRPLNLDLYKLASLLILEEELAHLTAKIPVPLPAVFAQIGQPRRALALAAGIANDRSRSEALAQVAVALAGAGQFELALSAAEQALAAAAGTADHRASVLTQVAAALAGIGQTDQARSTAEQALAMAEDIADNWSRGWVLTQLAVTLMDAGQIEPARSTAERALAAAEDIADNWSRAEALTWAATALARTGHTDQARSTAEQALAMAEDIADNWSRGWVLTQLAVTLMDAGQIEPARSTAERALAVAEAIADNSSRAAALTRLAAALARTGHTERAHNAAQQARNAAGQTLVAVEDIPDVESRASVLTLIAATLAEAGESEPARSTAERALAVAEAIADNSSRAAALTRLAAALRRDRYSAVGAFVLTDDQTVDLSRAYVLTQVAAALARAGQTEQGRSVAERALMAADGVPVDWGGAAVLADIATSLALAGRTERARSTAERALVAAEGTPVDWLRARVLPPVAAALARAGQTEQARTTVERALVAAEGIPVEWVRAGHLADIAVTLARAELIEPARSSAERALMAAEGIPNAGLPAQVSVRIVVALAETGQINRALVALEGIIGDELRASAFAQVASALARIGQNGRSRSAAEEALVAARGIPDQVVRVEVLGRAALAMAEAGFAADSAEIVGAAWATSREVFVGWPALFQVDPSGARRIVERLDK